MIAFLINFKNIFNLLFFTFYSAHHPDRNVTTLSLSVQAPMARYGREDDVMILATGPRRGRGVPKCCAWMD